MTVLQGRAEEGKGAGTNNSVICRGGIMSLNGTLPEFFAFCKLLLKLFLKNLFVCWFTAGLDTVPNRNST